MAAREPYDREHASPHDAEAQHRFERVARARRIETAHRAEERAHGPLVEADQECDEVAHCSPTFFQSAARLSRSACGEASRARGPRLTTTSTAGSQRPSRRKGSGTRRAE